MLRVAKSQLHVETATESCQTATCDRDDRPMNSRRAKAIRFACAASSGNVSVLARELPRFSPLTAGHCTNMHITRHHDFASLASSLSIWNELAHGVPFRRWDWLEAWWRNYGCDDQGKAKPNHRLFVLTVHDDDGNLVGIAPWYQLRTRSGAARHPLPR